MDEGTSGAEVLVLADLPSRPVNKNENEMIAPLHGQDLGDFQKKIESAEFMEE